MQPHDHHAPRLVGSRAPGLLDTHAWLDDVAGDAAISRVDIASAYWGARAVADALALVPATGGDVRLLLWDLGGTKARLGPLLAAAIADPRIDVRFIGSTVDGGTFHPKVIGIRDAGGGWSRALVGSANFTRNARERNVEVGVEVLDPDALAQLRAWFEAEFDAALAAAQVDVPRARAVLPDDPPKRGAGFAPPSGER